MPRQLKRRSEAISRDASESEPEASPEPPRRRQRSSSGSPPSSISGGEEEANTSATQAETHKKTLVKKLVRLALASEYSRIPLRRTDISTKIFRDGNSQSARQFKGIFAEAQKQLKNVFGMQLVELPSKEKTSLKDRRNQATQTKVPSTTSKSWILVSVLPKAYKENKNIMQPTHAPSVLSESEYTAFYTVVVGMIYLNSNELTEQKLERYLKRFNAETNTPVGTLEKTVARMIREGYVEKKRENVGGEDQISYVVGPRGKVEVGMKGTAGVVKSVYGLGAVEFNNGPKMEEEELNKRLSRSLGIEVGETRGERDEAEEEGEVEVQEQQQQQQRRSGRRKARTDDDDE